MIVDCISLIRPTFHTELNGVAYKVPNHPAVLVTTENPSLKSKLVQEAIAFYNTSNKRSFSPTPSLFFCALRRGCLDF